MTTEQFEQALAFPRPAQAPVPPRLVPGWYVVCASRELRAGAVRRFDLADEALVVFRGKETGIVHALPAHCIHQGVDLAHGAVSGDCLRCPLHHWEYTDRCVKIPGRSTALNDAGSHYVAAERFGMVFVYTGPSAAHGIPSFTVTDEDLYFRPGKAVTVECPWYVPVANAFDMTHLRTIHRRELRVQPAMAFPDPVTFTCDYSTAVVGDGWSDRAMRLLSGNVVRVNVTCSAGTIITVESHVRRRRGFLLVSLRPTRSGVSILPVFGVPRTRFRMHALQGRISAALFTAFLSRDVVALSGIRFPPGFLDNDDPTINTCYRYLCGLPEYERKET